jgi:hypothetical protein
VEVEHDAVGIAQGDRGQERLSGLEDFCIHSGRPDQPGDGAADRIFVVDDGDTNPVGIHRGKVAAAADSANGT